MSCCQRRSCYLPDKMESATEADILGRLDGPFRKIRPVIVLLCQLHTTCRINWVTGVSCMLFSQLVIALEVCMGLREMLILLEGHMGLMIMSALLSRYQAFPL